MNFLYIIMSIAFGYWLGTPSKNITPIVNCPVAEQSKDAGQVHESKPSEPVVVEPISNKKASPSPTPEVQIDDPSPAPSPDQRAKMEDRGQRMYEEISQRVVWSLRSSDSEDRIVTMTLDSDDLSAFELIRDKLKDGNITIVGEREIHIGNFVYEIRFTGAQ